MYIRILSYIIQVSNFFKERIEKQYPKVQKDVDVYEAYKYDHNAFMTSRSEMVFGREGILKEVGLLQQSLYTDTTRSTVFNYNYFTLETCCQVSLNWQYINDHMF